MWLTLRFVLFWGGSTKLTQQKKKRRQIDTTKNKGENFPHSLGPGIAQNLSTLWSQKKPNHSVLQ